MSDREKMIDGVLCVLCTRNNKYYPKYKKNKDLTMVFSEKHNLYVVDGMTPEQVDNALNAKDITEYHFSPYYGEARKKYIYKNKKDLYIQLELTGAMYSYLESIEKQACEMEDSLVEKMRIQEGVTEELKNKNPMEWVGKMNNIVNRAREIVQQTLIFSD